MPEINASQLPPHGIRPVRDRDVAARFSAPLISDRKTSHFDVRVLGTSTDTTKDDLSILLCGSDPAHSQIEFGAHQVVLVQTKLPERLPAELQTASF